MDCVVSKARQDAANNLGTMALLVREIACGFREEFSTQNKSVCNSVI